MTTKQLQNQRVLITRPAAQAQHLLNSIKALKAEALTFPLLSIQALNIDLLEHNQSKNKILNLDQYQQVIFISTNAARIGAELIHKYWPQLPIQINWIGIGQSTVQQLQDLQIPAQNLNSQGRSEELLQAEILQQVAGQRILIIRGIGGRELLAEQLQLRGATVEYADLYQRLCPSYEDDQVSEYLHSLQSIYILISSSESLDNLIHIAQGSKQQFKLDTLKNNCLLVVPSPRIEQQAKQLGFQQIVLASSAQDSAMLEALIARSKVVNL